MAVIDKVPVKEVGVQPPTVTAPVAPPTPMWKLIWGWVVAGLAVIGLGLALGLGVVNTLDINSLQDDVSAMQTELSATQEQLSKVNMDLIYTQSGYSLAHEHLAQAPQSYGLMYEHLAQAPGTP
jgi:hypothetical protein